MEMLKKYKGLLICLLALAVFLELNLWTGKIRPMHFLFVGAILALYFATPRTRIYIVLAIPMLLKEMLFDSLRYVPFHWLTPIHVGEPYHWDQLLFSFSWGGSTLLPHQFLPLLGGAALDLFTAVIYHLLDPMMFILLLVFWTVRSADLAARFSSAYLLMNLFAFATYILYPAAPPWYVSGHGFIQPLAPIAGSAAGLVQFDHLLGFDISQKFYSASPVVFGAIPSMHAGFTTLGCLYGFKVNKKLGIALGCYGLAMCFAAIYSQHHYAVDLVIGILYALSTYWLLEGFLLLPVRKMYGKLLNSLVLTAPVPLFGRNRKIDPGVIAIAASNGTPASFLLPPQ